MAYRRKHSISRVSTFATDDFRSPSEDSSSSSLAAQAIRASSAHRDSSFSSAYGESALSSPYRDSNRTRFSQSPRQDSTAYEYTSMKTLNESKDGFWGILARKAKSILEDDNVAKQFESPTPQMLETSIGGQYHQSHRSPEAAYRKNESPTFQKGLDAFTSSLNYIGGTIGNAFEGGLTKMETRTHNIISETRKLQIRRKGATGSNTQNQATDISGLRQPPQMQTDQETQLKASRDVANAMAAKAKLLLRELKTVKADLAFAKQRCAQLEEENKILRESQEKGDSPEDDDLIRLQLETLLAEKARLANENSIYARENRFLREIVEYHQLTMQDVVYLDEGIEEVTEVGPIPITQQVADALPVPTPPPGFEVPTTVLLSALPPIPSSKTVHTNPTLRSAKDVATPITAPASPVSKPPDEADLKRQSSLPSV
ncbi:uncharacterized protein LOC143851105 [Tasmannia lanceolata]|uniref:uncharacterized protein LOC143851105 n=1 Tax=Tasmannia lanceolata TaxID=3420 RepID=UPI0040632FA1